MAKAFVALLLLWEPLTFATTLLAVLPTMWFRGWQAAVELVVHGGVAAFCVFAALSLFNDAPDARRLARLAIAVSYLRVVQSHYWSALPNNTPPGSAPFQVAVTTAVCAIAVLLLHRAPERT